MANSKKIFFAFLLFFLAFSVKSYSEIVTKVNVKGNERISLETIVVFGDIALGKDYEEADINLLIKKLYESNFFSNISVELKDGLLSISVEENPIINLVIFKGEKADKYKEALNKILTLSEKTSFLRNFVKSDINTMREFYRHLGFYFVKIDLELEKLSKNRIRNNKLLYVSTFMIFSFIITIIYFSGERIAYASLLLGITIVIFFSKNLRKILLLSIFFSLIISFFIYNFHPIYQNIKIIESTAKHEGLTIEKEYTCKNNIEEKCKKLFKVQPKFIEVLRNFKGSAYGEIYLTATKIWMDNKFFGIGLNNFTSVCKNELQYNRFFCNWCAPNNIRSIYAYTIFYSIFI